MAAAPHQSLHAWAIDALFTDVPLDVLADALPYSGAGHDEAAALIDHLADAGWIIVPTPRRGSSSSTSVEARDEVVEILRRHVMDWGGCGTRGCNCSHATALAYLRGLGIEVGDE